MRASVKELLEYQDENLKLNCTRVEVLLTAVESQARYEANMLELSGLFSIAEEDAAIDNNSDNGKHGMWLVSGIRHTCLVNDSGVR